MCSPAFNVGLQFLRILDHAHDLVILVAAGRLGHTDGAAAFLDDGAGVNRFTRSLGYGDRFSGQRGLVHHAVAFQNDTVQGNQVSGLHEDPVIRLYLTDGDENLCPVAGEHPDLIHVQGHGFGQIVHRLLVRPFVDEFPDAKQEGHLTCRTVIAAQQADPDGNGVQHLYIKSPVQETAESAPEPRQCLDDGQHLANFHGQKQLSQRTEDKLAGHPVFIFMLKGTCRTVRNRQFRHPVVIKRRKSPENAFAFRTLFGHVRGIKTIADYRICGSLIDFHFDDAGDAFQILLEPVGFGQ